MLQEHAEATDECAQHYITREDCEASLLELDANGVAEHQTGRLARWNYLNLGPNYLIHRDIYDKSKKYGICIHGGICGYRRLPNPRHAVCLEPLHRGCDEIELE